MKKTPCLTLIFILIVSMAISACGNSDLPSAAGDSSSAGSSSAESETAPTYKETMLPFDQLQGADRIIILQNTLNFSRDGFYTRDTQPQTQGITYDGQNVEAYPITYAIGFLYKGLSGDVTVHNNDGSTVTVPADAFTGLYVIVDFMSGAPPVLYNPSTGDTFRDFLFAVTSEGEAIYSVVSDSTHNTKALVESVGWDGNATYRYVASDKFYIPVGPADNATGELRGALSGAVNGSFPELAIASGKINDVIYIEKIHE